MTKQAEIRILSIAGKVKMKQKITNPYEELIDISKLPHGLYFVVLYQSGKPIMTRRMSKF